MRRLVLCALVFSLSLFFFAPARLYPHNYYEFSISLLSLWSWSSVFILVSVVGLSTVGSFLNHESRKLFCVLLICLTALFYLQSTLFVWDYGKFDGGLIDWSEFHLFGVLEIFVWAAILFFFWRKYQQIYPHLRFLALLLILVQALLLARDSIQSPQMWTDMNYQGTDLDIYKLSKNEPNVMVFLLDGFTQESVQVIKNKHPGIKKSLSDFEPAKDHISNYSGTPPSISTMLSGIPYRGEKALSKYWEKTFAKQNIVSFLETKGFDPAVVSLSQLCPSPIRDYCLDMATPTDPNYQKSLLQRMAPIYDLVLFQMGLHFLRPALHNGSFGLLQQADQHTTIPNIRSNQSFKLLRSLEQKLTLGSPKPRFLFYHAILPHAPFLLTEDCEALDKHEAKLETYLGQASCTLQLIAKVVKQMQSLGVYDNSLIVVTSDHGSRSIQHWHPDSPHGDTPFPLLLVKPLSDKNLDIAPSSLEALAEIIVSELGYQEDYPLQAPGSTRYFYRFDQHHWDMIEANEAPQTTIYEVKSPAQNPDSWQRLEN